VAVFVSLPYCPVIFTSPPSVPTAVATPFASTVTTELLSTLHLAFTLVPPESRSKSTGVLLPFVTTIVAVWGLISRSDMPPPKPPTSPPAAPLPLVVASPPAPVPLLFPFPPPPHATGAAAKNAPTITSNTNQALRIWRSLRSAPTWQAPFRTHVEKSRGIEASEARAAPPWVGA
jgi:hypothetical protein